MRRRLRAMENFQKSKSRWLKIVIVARKFKIAKFDFLRYVY